MTIVKNQTNANTNTTATVGNSIGTSCRSVADDGRVRIAPDALSKPFDGFVEQAVRTIAESAPVEDEVLGRFVGLASRIRSVSFHEGKLLEQGLIAVAETHPDLLVLSQGLRLPIVPSALEALKANNWGALQGLSFDADVRTRKCYTPDLIIINRKKRTALVIDLKRSLASYGDTNRMDALRLRMMAAALVVPDWLYKEYKRLSVDTVGIAIIDGASRPSDHDSGIWGLSEIDALLEIDGAAAAMADLRARFAARVQGILRQATKEALGLPASEAEPPAVTTNPQEDQPVGFSDPVSEEKADEEPAKRRVVTFGLAARPQHALRMTH